MTQTIDTKRSYEILIASKSSVSEALLSNPVLRPILPQNPPRRPEESQAAGVGGVVDQFGETLEAGFFFFGADYPPTDDLAVGGRLGLEEGPSHFVLAQNFFVRLGERGSALLVGIDTGLVGEAGFECFQAGRLHAAFGGKFAGQLDVDRAPNAARPARAETDGVTVVVHAFSDAVDPAETEGFDNRLGPGDAGLAGILFMEADPQFWSGRVVLLEPLVEIGRGFKECEIHFGLTLATPEPSEKSPTGSKSSQAGAHGRPWQAAQNTMDED